MKRNWRAHYNILTANIVLFICVALDFAVIGLMEGNVNLLLISPIIGILISGLLYFFDVRYFISDYPYTKFHFNKKWTKFYIAGIIVYSLTILTVFVIILAGTLVYSQAHKDIVGPDVSKLEQLTKTLTIFLWVSCSLAAFFGLISFGLIKYARFKIDVELLRSAKGENEAIKKVDDKPVIIDLSSDSKTRDVPPVQEPKKADDNTPSAGLSSI